ILFDNFQQCNSGFQIAGESLAHYFPPLSEDFSKPLADAATLSDFNVLILPWFNRGLMTTKKGYLGYVPRHSRAGDQIFVLMGCDAPLVLRPLGNETYQLVGECYLHGVMYGEAIDALDKGEYETETVT